MDTSETLNCPHTLMQLRFIGGDTKVGQYRDLLERFQQNSMIAFF